MCMSKSTAFALQWNSSRGGRGGATAAEVVVDPVVKQVGLALEWVVKAVERAGAREWLMKQSQSTQLSAEQKESQFRDGWKQVQRPLPRIYPECP